MSRDPDTFISPTFLADKLDNPSLEDLIDVFEDRVARWLLEPAKSLLGSRNGQVAGFALLQSYFEGIWIYIQGQESKDKSKRFFREGFVDVYSPSKLPDVTLRNLADVLYEDARCGFFHDAMFRDRIYFADLPNGAPISITLPLKNGVPDEAGEIQTVLVNPSQFVRYIEGHFSKYIARLRDPAENDARQKFEEACKLKWRLGGKQRNIVLPPGMSS